MNVRYSGLDAARAFFLIIGVALHSIQPFAHDYVWRVTHVSAIDNAWLLIEFVRDFRMYGFFMISGFFFSMLYEKRGGVDYIIKDRILRVLIPLVVIGSSVNILAAVISDSNFYNTELNFKFFWEADWLGHLWFISNLIVYYMLSYILFKFFDMNFQFSKSVLNMAIIYFLFLPLSSLVFRFFIFKFLEHDRILFLDFGMFVKYISYYFFGAIVWFRRDVLFVYLNGKMAASGALIYAALQILMLIITNKYGVAIIDSLSTSFLTISIISLFNVLYKKTGSLVSKLVDSSYTIYLFHQPFIIIYFYFWGLYIMINPVAHYLMVFFGVTTVSYMIHIMIRKSVYLKFMINGVVNRP